MATALPAGLYGGDAKWLKLRWIAEVKLAEEILRLKRQRSAIILAHNYQRGEVQER